MKIENNIKKLISTEKVKYKAFKAVFCPYLNDFVNFTYNGFRHLLWRRRGGKRNNSDIAGRMNSIVHIHSILSKSGTLQEYENSETEYFAFIAIVDSNKYKVIIMRDIEGKYKFVSIIPKWKTGTRDQYYKRPILLE